jgi:hypothetical protein
MQASLDRMDRWITADKTEERKEAGHKRKVQ